MISGVQGAISRGPVVDPTAANGILDFLANKDAIDDRKGFFTTALSTITKLPPGKLQDTLNDEAIAVLYNTLTHPPPTYIGPSYRFRSADGSGNNPVIPWLGKAGLPYARSVQSKHPLPANVLPDPGLVFDTILKARDVSASVGSARLFSFFRSVLTITSSVQGPSWSKLIFDLCICFARHPLSLQDRRRRPFDKQHNLLPRPFSPLWIQPANSG